jgi:gliding motility-associated-like protein
LVGINLDTSIVIGQYVTLPINNQNGLVNFNWTPTTGLSCLACSNPLVQPLDDIMYSAFVSDILGCFTATSTFKIHIFPETFVKLPTTFTPNGDGVNDVIYVQGWGLKDLLTFEIYNRWGELVFKTSELTEGWDGYYKGMLQNNDIYVYKVAAQTYRNTEISYEGHFNLMR